MVNSPKKTPPPCPPSKFRPGTPHYNAKTFDFASVDNSSRHPIGEEFDFPMDESDHHADIPSTGSCMGISLATVMNTFRGPSLLRSLPTSPVSVHGDDGDMFHRFHRFRSAVQKTLTCTANKTYMHNSNSCINENRHVSFDCDTFEFDGERSLMQRAASWGTLETGYSSSLNNEGKSSDSNPQVQFHYPPITSVRLRPRTESDDIKQLFFAPEELDEIEDDRSDTRAADDVETLAVGEANDWNDLPACTSSIITASDYDDQDTRSELMLAGNGASSVMFDHALSPRKRERNVGERRFVRGVQIMLREKSTG